MDHLAKVVVVVTFTQSREREPACSTLRQYVQSEFCGRGTCDVFGYVCKCDGGWSQFYVGASFRFLPCVVPNCSINYKCFNDSEAPVAPPEPPRITNLSDLCSYAYCGGGSCARNSTFGHRCDCREGYNNLPNITSFSCYRDCSFGADCSDLGISLNNSSSSSSSQPSLSDSDQNQAVGLPPIACFGWTAVWGFPSSWL